MMLYLFIIFNISRITVNGFLKTSCKRGPPKKHYGFGGVHKDVLEALVSAYMRDFCLLLC